MFHFVPRGMKKELYSRCDMLPEKPGMISGWRRRGENVFEGRGCGFDDNAAPALEDDFDDERIFFVQSFGFDDADDSFLADVEGGWPVFDFQMKDHGVSFLLSFRLVTNSSKVIPGVSGSW